MEQYGVLGALAVVNFTMNFVILVICAFIFLKVRLNRKFLQKD